MNQSLDEKTARYLVIKLMFDDKFQEAEALLSEFTASGLIDRSYSDFYYVILDAIGIKPTDQQTSAAPELSPDTVEIPCHTSALGSINRIPEEFHHQHAEAQPSWTENIVRPAS